MLRKTFLFGLMVVAFSSGILNCSTANQDSPLSLVGADGRHPSGWIAGHGTYALPDGSRCTDCHGDDLRGAPNAPSCFSATFNGLVTCHASGPAFHAEGLLDKLSADFHGSAYSGDPVSCYLCHDPADPLTPPGYNCLDCHFSEDGTQRVPTGSSYAHSTTGTDHTLFVTPERDVCVICHEINNSFGYDPFCHNCHVTHPDPDWETPGLHGAAAKAAPGTSTGFGSCRVCHGDDFAGGNSLVSCRSLSACHQQDLPHPSDVRWESEAAPTHRDTDTGNAPECGLCHLGDQRLSDPVPVPPGADPGCFNNTLCHGAAHAAPYVSHYVDASAEADFNSVCSGCHAISGPQPDVDATACDACHLGGSPYQYPACTSCHEDPPDGRSPVGNQFPNRRGRHGGDHGSICTDCHGTQGSGSGLDHYYPVPAFLDVPLTTDRTPTQVTCTGVCHNKTHSSDDWY